MNANALPRSLRSRLAPAVLLALSGLAIAASGARAASAAGPKHDQPPPAPGPEPSAQGFTTCSGGSAGTYPCHGLDLQAYLPRSVIGARSQEDNGNDAWGWTDPDTGREYALMGLANGTSFVDISDPRRPIYLGILPTHGPASPWRGIKIHRYHAFVVADRSIGHGMQVFDLRRLREVPSPPVTFTEDAHYAGVGTVHNIALNEETGFAYLAGANACDGGLHMVDVRDPLRPAFAGCFAADGYSHDVQCVVYRGPDRRYEGRELCFASNEDTLTIVDVTDKAAPRQVSRTSYAGARYTHQTWLTEDHRYALTDDEFDEVELGHPARTYVWDLLNLEAPLQFAHYDSPATSIDHNLYIKDGKAYQANYTSGVRVLDLEHIGAGQLTEIAFFDVVPENDAPDFLGLWNVFPFFSSGSIIASGIDSGLWVWEHSSAAPQSCAADADTLCLLGGRFAVEVEWFNQFNGRRGTGRSVPNSDLAGYFAFDDPSNLELMVKILDFGDEILVFHGQLTNLHFALDVTDVETGERRRYRNTIRNCGAIDHSDFHTHGDHQLGPAAGISPKVRLFPTPRQARLAKRLAASGAKRGSCVANANRLCLVDHRFAVELDWRNQFNGAAGPGKAAALSDLTGSFAFDDARNTEVLVKTLDFGDRVLVIWGSLSDLEYTIRVADTVGGGSESYHNPPGTFCGGLDADAF